MKKKIIWLFMFIFMLAGVTSCQIKDEPNPLMEKIDLSIEQFISNYASTYLQIEESTSNVDYHVIASLHALEANGYQVSLESLFAKEKAIAYLATLDYTYPSNIFKAAVIDQAYNMITSSAKTALANLTTVDNWSLTYTYSALNYYQVNDSLKTTIKAKLNVINPEDYRDADYAGMALIVTAHDELDKAPLYKLIKDSITDKGITAWGNANACSTSYSIMGLLASKIDLSKSYLDTNNKSLIENLLKYEVNGAFRNYLDDTQADLKFATPQGFAALVSYKLTSKLNKPMVLF